MTVQVVGKAENLLKQTTCMHCLSLLKYAPNDVKELISTDYTGGKDVSKYLPCPVCSTKVFVRN